MGTCNANVTIRNRTGLHSRPAAMIAAACSRFLDTTIEVQHNGMKVNGKNVLSLMTLAASCGREIFISATGEEAEAAVQEIVKMVEDGFGEKN
jgi:phosphocarrier protein